MPTRVVSYDAYLAATGSLQGESCSVQENAVALAQFALRVQAYCATVVAPDGTPIRCRLGLHCGPLVAGVCGGSMPRYHLFGATVSDTGRIESAGQAGSVHVSQNFASMLWREDAAPAVSSRARRLTLADLGDSERDALLTDDGSQRPSQSGPIDESVRLLSSGSGTGRKRAAAAARAAEAARAAQAFELTPTDKPVELSTGSTPMYFLTERAGAVGASGASVDAALAEPGVGQRI